MTCTQLSTLQPEATTTLLPGTPPTNNQEWQAVRIALQTVLQQIRAAAGVTGVNAVPQQYALFAGASLPPMTFSGCSGSLDTSNVLFGAGSLKLALSSSPASVTFASDTAWPIAHNRSWIVSFYAMASETTKGTITITTPKASYTTDFTLPAGSTFGRYYDTLNLIADGSTSFGLSFSFTSGATVWLDGIQLEPYFGVAIAPSPFISTSPALTLDNQPDGTTYVRLAGSHAAGNVAYNFRGVWSSTTSYVQGDEVVYEASYWLATASSTGETPATGSSYWQVVGSYSGFQGAWSSTVSYVQGAEVTYNGNYWVCVTANTDSAPSTTNSNWQIAGPLNLDSVADGTTYARTRAAVLGSNLPLRPAMATILSLNPTHYWPISGPQGYDVDLGSSPSNLQPISTGSVAFGVDLFGLSGRLAPGDAQSLVEFETNGAQYATGTPGLTAYVVGGVIASPAGAIPSGPLVVMGWQNTTTTSPPAYSPALWMTPDGYAHAAFYKSSGILTIQSRLTYTFRDPHLLAMQVYYDSTSGYTTINLFVDGVEVDGGSILGTMSDLSPLYYTIGGSAGNGYPGFGPGFTSNAVLIQDVFVFEGRTLSTADYFALFQALTPGRGTSSGFLYRGSVPPQSSTASFSYTSTTSSITISWNAFTVYWPDGTTQAVSSGSQEFTGLSASTTYYFYPYLRQADGTIQFAGGANTARSASNASLASNFGVVPLSSGAITASTPASGTGGGEIGSCLHESQPVFTRHGMVPAGELKVGDELWTPEGEWVPILTLRAEPETEWVSINGLLVTKSQPFMSPTGKPIRAAYLDLGTRIRTEDGEMPVVEVRFFHEPARKIILGIRPPHWFILTPRGAIVHNGSVKP